jgi:4,5-dihydroxyphthalate decarboxylase
LSNLNLSFAITPYDRVLPLITGDVKPSGIVLEYEPNPSPTSGSPVPRMFFEQIKYQRYDVSEMSFSSFLIERAKGWPYVALPVFHNRNFRYAGIVVRKASGIRQDQPEDLKGKRFSIPDYQMSMGLWTRGILQHEFGVLPPDMQWLQTRGERFSHTGARGTALPEGVRLRFANTAEADLFARGEADASITLDATTAGTTTLFSDPRAEAIRFYRKTSIFPPHHITVARLISTSSTPKKSARCLVMIRGCTA